MACSSRRDQAAETALDALLCSEPEHVTAALQTLSGLLRADKEGLVECILREHRHGFIGVLTQFLSSADSWQCNTAAYLLGVLLEREALVQELKEEALGIGCSLVSVLVGLLTKENLDTVTNAAGAIASLAESGVGRALLQRDDAVLCQALSGLAALLGREKGDAVNSAALALARISLSEATCQRLLSLPCAPDTLRHLAECLVQSHTDTAMNAAYALGRLCEVERGHALVLDLVQDHDLVSSLQTVLCDSPRPGAAQTACFAFRCLAAEADGHALVLESPAFPRLLDGLHRCLLADDEDSAWFAATVVRTLVSRPPGVVCVRDHGQLEKQLQSLSCSKLIGQELQEEVSQCLNRLQRLPKPPPPTARRLPSGSYIVSWEKCTPESGLEVTYSLLDEDRLLYRGTDCNLTLLHSTLRSELPLSLRLVLSTADNDVSPCSEPTLLAVEKEKVELRPGPPQRLCVTECTATQVRLNWVAPNGAPRPKAYRFYQDETLLGTTMHCRAILGALTPGTLYQLAVCAVGPDGVVGPCVQVEVRTPDGSVHAPSRVTVTVLGRHELLITWEPPGLALGRLFNYELRVNRRVMYLGTERTHIIRRLSADTAYTCTVTAITSEGRWHSQPVTKRTACDEHLRKGRYLQSLTMSPLQGLAPLLPCRGVLEVGNQIRALHCKHPPRTPLSPRCEQNGKNKQDKRRWSMESLTSKSCERPQTLRQRSKVAMGTVSSCDIDALQKSVKEELTMCMATALSSHKRPSHQELAKTAGRLPAMLPEGFGHRRTRAGTGEGSRARQNLLLTGHRVQPCFLDGSVYTPL